MYYYKLKKKSIICIEGKDATSFLQDIITNNINKLRTNRAIYSTLLSPQGKLLHDFFLFKDAEKIYLDVPKYNIKKLQEKLNLVNQSKKDFNELFLDKSKKDEMISKIKFYQDENTRLSNEKSLDASKKDEMISKIKFYQDENTRLSSEIINFKKKHETIKNNFDDVENEKNNIFKKIKELNNSLIKNNIIGTPFVKETVAEDSINSKILNDITDTNLKKEKGKTKQNNDLDDQISNIFK